MGGAFGSCKHDSMGEQLIDQSTMSRMPTKRMDPCHDTRMKHAMQTLSHTSFQNMHSYLDSSASGIRSGGGSGRGLVYTSREDKIAEGRRLLTYRVEQMKIYTVKMLDDGNCLFRACAFEMYGSQHYHLQVRSMAVEHMRKHPGQYSYYYGTHKEFEGYINSMQKPKTWGDELVLRAICDCFSVEIHVLTSNTENFYLAYKPSSNSSSDASCAIQHRCLFLSYLDPVHYDALQPPTQY